VEALALTLARNAGIAVPGWCIEIVSGKTVLLLRRFDRDAERRISFLSAMSLLSAQDGETRSYLEMVDALRQHGSQPEADTHQLWRRMVFNVLISNTDDHLRNHGFLYVRSQGWRLSPAYDLNPVPADVKLRGLSTAVTLDDTTASLRLSLEVAEYFGLSPNQARRIAAEAGAAVPRWRTEAARLGLTPRAVERMESAFDHRDLAQALTFRQRPPSRAVSHERFFLPHRSFLRTLRIQEASWKETVERGRWSSIRWNGGPPSTPAICTTSPVGARGIFPWTATAMSTSIQPKIQPGPST